MNWFPIDVYKRLEEVKVYENFENERHIDIMVSRIRLIAALLVVHSWEIRDNIKSTVGATGIEK